MSTSSSIPEEPSTPIKEESEVSCYPPRHPVPCMQAAFEESMYEQGHPPPTNPYAITFGDGREQPVPEFTPKYHPLTKLISQITFGIHLLHKRLAKSDSEVVRILQSHVNDMDTFLSTTTHDFDLARSDISTRIKNLQVPLENGPASEVFESMLRDPTFRAQIMAGNKKVEYVIKRTTRAMNKALEDVGQGLRAVDELAKYLLTLKTGWRNANLVRVYGAMTHNVEGWFRCFMGLQMKGQVLGERLNTLKTIVWEIERRCGRVSRRESMGALNSSLVKKKPSLNQIPENPTYESQDVISALNNFEDKPLPETPVPTPIDVNTNHALWPKRSAHASSSNRNPSNPRRTLSKRRSVSGPLPSQSSSTSKPQAHPADQPAANPRPMTTSTAIPDEKSKEKKLKKKHRRSQSSITMITVDASESGEVVSKSTSLSFSLRRSLSLGRSSKKEREKKDENEKEKGDVNADSSEAAVPPVPPLPATCQDEGVVKEEEVPEVPKHDEAEGKTSEEAQEKEDVKGEAVIDGQQVGEAEDITPTTPTNELPTDQEAGPSIKKKKSKAHLHHPSGQFSTLQKRKSVSSIASAKTANTSFEKENVPPTPPLPTVLASGPAKAGAQEKLTTSPTHEVKPQSRPRSQTTSSKSHSRRQSFTGGSGNGVLSVILGLRPKSRHGNANNNKENASSNKEKAPPVPPIPAQPAPKITTTALVARSKTGSVLSKQSPVSTASAGALISGSTILQSVKELHNTNKVKNSTPTKGDEDSLVAVYNAPAKRDQAVIAGPAFKLNSAEPVQRTPSESQGRSTVIKEALMKEIKVPNVTPTKQKTGPSGLGNAIKITTGASTGPPSVVSAKGSRITRAATMGTNSSAIPSPKSPSRGFLFKFFSDRSF